MAFAFRLEHKTGRRPTRQSSKLRCPTGGWAIRLRWGEGRCAWLMFETTTQIKLQCSWLKIPPERALTSESPS
jgi:hypothetical protein